MRGPFVGAASILGSLLAGPSAWAQTTPSSAQILHDLTPNPSMLHAATDGIRPVAPPAPDSSPSATMHSPTHSAPIAAQVPSTVPKQSVGSQPTADRPSVNLAVEFVTDSAALTAAAREALDELGKALDDPVLVRYRFRIEGHTDTVGTRTYNQALSERRAAAVVAYISEKFRVSTSHLQAVGMGEDNLVVPTPPQTPEARNRAVRVINIGS